MYDKIINQAIKKYGKDKQTIVAIEELSELQKELLKAIRGKIRRKKLVEEFADVSIMMKQVKIMYNINQSEIDRLINEKITRLKYNLKENTTNDKK